MNSLKLPSGEIIPTYMRFDPVKRIAVRTVKTSPGLTVEVYDTNAVLLWSRSFPDGEYVSGGFDANNDGYVDLVIECAEDITGLCGSKQMQRSWLEIVSGLDGTTLKTTPKVNDFCDTYLLDTWRHWQAGSVMFGASSDTVVIHHAGIQDETTLGEIWVQGGDLNRTPWKYWHPSNPSWATYTQAVIPFGFPARKPQVGVPLRPTQWAGNEVQQR